MTRRSAAVPPNSAGVATDSAGYLVPVSNCRSVIPIARGSGCPCRASRSYSFPVSAIANSSPTGYRIASTAHPSREASSVATAPEADPPSAGCRDRSGSSSFDLWSGTGRPSRQRCSTAVTAADQHAATVTSLTRSRAGSSRSARSAALTRSGFPAEVSISRSPAVPGDVDDVPALGLLQHVPQPLAGHPVLQHSHVRRLPGGGDAPDESYQRVPLAAKVQ